MAWRRARKFVPAGFALLLSAGCAHMAEKGALEAFRTSLSTGDMIGLKAATSDRFEERALRLDESVDDLKVLKLPTSDKPEIVSVEDLGESEKLVTVEVGESKRKLKYRLVKDGSSRKWVVDDVYLRQKKDGVTSVKSVTEQMDLLLTVREFLRAWGAADRNAMLAGTTEPFRATLEPLPPAHLAQMAKQAVGNPDNLAKIRPEAQLDDDVAVVKIPRPTGQMVVTFELKKGAWLASDMAVESRGDKEHIPSVRKHAIALHTALSFLKAYHDEDRATLAKVSTKRFYDSGLAPGDLKSVPLPESDAPLPDQQFRIIAKRAELLIPTEKELVKVSMIREDAVDDDSPVTYRVEDVTLYEHKGGQEKRLSSVFTAQALMSLFSESLASRDLPMLRKVSSADFNRRVWDRLKQSGPPGTTALASAGSNTTIDDLPLGEIPPLDPVLVETAYNGAVTEMRVRQGEAELTYVLREHAGEVRVDDILYPAPGRPRSLKETAELIVPLREFTAGIRRKDLGLLQRMSSDEYNRMVWKQTDRLPEGAALALRHLQAPVSRIETHGDQVLLTLGDDRWGAKVVLAKEFSRHVVDDVLVVEGVEAAQRTRMKQSMRLELAGTQARRLRDVERPSPLLDENVIPAGGERAPQGVVNAGYEREVDARPLQSEPEAFPDLMDAVPLPRRTLPRTALPGSTGRHTAARPTHPGRTKASSRIKDADADLLPPDPDDSAFLAPGAEP